MNNQNNGEKRETAQVVCPHSTSCCIRGWMRMLGSWQLTGSSQVFEYYRVPTKYLYPGNKCLSGTWIPGLQSVFLHSNYRYVKTFTRLINIRANALCGNFGN